MRRTPRRLWTNIAAALAVLLGVCLLMPTFVAEATPLPGVGECIFSDCSTTDGQVDELVMYSLVAEIAAHSFDATGAPANEHLLHLAHDSDFKTRAPLRVLAEVADELEESGAVDVRRRWSPRLGFYVSWQPPALAGEGADTR